MARLFRVFGIWFFLFASVAHAALIDRGEGFIYDDVLDVTWAQNANINGADTWDNQVAWVSGYSQTHSVYGTFDDWRLPTVIDTGAPGCDEAPVGTDCGQNVDTSASEMASLFYDTLGNLSYVDTSGNGPQSGWGLTNTGPFANLQADLYWSGSEYAEDPFALAWYFRFYNGAQGASVKYLEDYYAMAVRDGDIAASVVPIPAALWLFVSALAALGWIRSSG